MQIVTVEREHYYKYIPLRGWDQVRAALMLYGSGEAGRGAQGQFLTRLPNVESFYLFLQGSLSSSVSRFLETELANASKRLEEHERWHKDYDYDGVGPFLKSSVTIEVLDRNVTPALYGLSLYGAYVGEKPERQLAAALGQELCLCWSKVTLTVASATDDTFVIDGEELAHWLAPVHPAFARPGAELARAIVHGETGQGSTGYQPLFHSPATYLWLHLNDLSVAGQWEHPWHVEGALLSGRTCESYRQRGTAANPELVFWVCGGQSTWEHRASPLWLPEQQEPVLRLTEAIAERLQAVQRGEVQ